MRLPTQRFPNIQLFFRVAIVASLLMLTVAIVTYCLPVIVPDSTFFRWSLLLLSLLATIWFTLQVATKPLHNMLEQIAAIQKSDDPKLRVKEDKDCELVELARSYNSLLGRVEEVKALQKETLTVKERLVAAIAGANDGLWDWHIESGKVWYAPKFKELLGYKDHESDFANTIDSLKEHIHQDDGPATWDAINKHIDNNEEFDVEKRIRRRRGSYKWFRIRAAGVRNSSGKVMRMSGSIRDVTERKKFEEALFQSNHDLEQFAVIASHDLQEPLRKVASFCGLLQQEYSQELDDTGRQYLDFAIDGASRMSTLVQDLLRYSKIGSESSSNLIADSEEALKLAILNLDEAIIESQAVITYDSLPELLAETREIAQLFQNLIGNAIKYRSAESPKIHITAEDDEDSWQFSVADNGIGIKPEFRERIFRIFQRLHSRNEHSGTGIGLAICKRVVDQLGGTIWVESNSALDSEQGSKFCFTVPKHKSTIYDSIRSDDSYEYV